MRDTPGDPRNSSATKALVGSHVRGGDPPRKRDCAAERQVPETGNFGVTDCCCQALPLRGPPASPPPRSPKRRPTRALVTGEARRLGNLPIYLVAGLLVLSVAAPLRPRPGAAWCGRRGRGGARGLRGRGSGSRRSACGGSATRRFRCTSPPCWLLRRRRAGGRRRRGIRGCACGGRRRGRRGLATIGPVTRPGAVGGHRA